MAAVVAPSPIPLGRVVESSTKRISNMDIEDILQLYTETVKVLKKIEKREETILAEHGIAARKRAYTHRGNDVSFGRITSNDALLTVSRVWLCYTGRRHSKESGFCGKLPRRLSITTEHHDKTSITSRISTNYACRHTSNNSQRVWNS